MSYRAHGSEMVPAEGGGYGGYGGYGGGGGGGGGGGYGGSPPRANGSVRSQYPIYQIDFSAVASGKRIASTKRRVRWRFGFTNMEAIRNGETGTACRGEEHDVTIIWSITSGKRQILMDGKEVHFSASRGSLLDFSWSVRGNHVLKVVAHASPPLSSTPGFRQYDMFVDGQSYFTMPKVYELGVKPGSGMAARAVDSGRYYDLQGGGYTGGPDREEEELKRAIAESLEESRRYLAKTGKFDEQAYNGDDAAAAAPEPPADLLDFSDDAPAPAPMPDTLSLVTYGGENQQYAASAAMYTDAMTMNSAPPAYNNYGAPPQQQQPQVQQYGAPPAQIQYAPPPQNQYAPPPQNQYAPVDQFAPQPPAQPHYAADQFAPQADDPFAPKPPPPPSHRDIANSILEAYAAPPQQNGGSHDYQQGYQTPIATNMPAEHPPQQEPGQAPQLSMNAAFQEPEGPPKSEVESALSKLVNFDNINEPAEQEVKLTMKKEEERKKKSKTSALPPTGTGWIGNNATLSQIQEVKPTKGHKDPSEIMKPPPMLFSPGAVNAGALVVHGQGPPPLQRGFGVGSGFGVGAQMGYGMQQQQMPPQGYYAQPPPQQYVQPPPQHYAQPPLQQYAQPPPQQYNNY